MPSRRNELVMGSVDNITDPCPRSRRRMSRYAVRELVAWLLMHQQRYVRQYDSLSAAVNAGAEHAGGSMIYAHTATLVLEELVGRTRDMWDMAEWHIACDVACLLIPTDPYTSVEGTRADDSHDVGGEG